MLKRKKSSKMKEMHKLEDKQLKMKNLNKRNRSKKPRQLLPTLRLKQISPRIKRP